MFLFQGGAKPSRAAAAAAVGDKENATPVDDAADAKPEKEEEPAAVPNPEASSL